MIAGINESKTLTKDISCECKYKFGGTKCNWNQCWNNNECRCEFKNHHICGKYYVWNPATCNCENGKYLASIMDDSKIICDEVIKSYNEEIKTIPTNFNEKRVTCKTQGFYILLAFLLMTIALLIDVISMYSYMIKYRWKHVLPFHNTNNKLNNFYIDSINWKWVI